VRINSAKLDAIIKMSHIISKIASDGKIPTRVKIKRMIRVIKASENEAKMRTWLKLASSK